MLAVDELKELIEENGSSSLFGILQAQRMDPSFAQDELTECLEKFVDEKTAKGLLAHIAIEGLNQTRNKPEAGVWTRHTVDLSLVRQYRKIQVERKKGASLSTGGSAAADGFLANCAADLPHLALNASGEIGEAATRTLGLFPGTIATLKQLFASGKHIPIAERALAELGTDEAASILLERLAEKPCLHTLYCLTQIQTLKVLKNLENISSSCDSEQCTVLAVNLGQWARQECHPLLQSLLRSEQEDTVVSSLWSISPHAQEVFTQELPQLLERDNPAIEVALIDTIGRVGTIENIPLLASFLSKTNVISKIVALESLVSLGPRRETLVENIYPLIKNSDVRIRLRALLALAPHVDSIDLQPLKVLAQNSETDVRLYVARYLGYIQSPTALKLLEHLFRLNDTKVQLQILQSLRNYPKEQCERIYQMARLSDKTAVQRALLHANPTDERDEYDEVLGKWLSGACTEAVAELEGLLSQGEPKLKAFQTMREMKKAAMECANTEGAHQMLWAELERSAQNSSNNK